MKNILLYILLFLTLIFKIDASFTCSRVLHSDSPAVLVGRNMDWFKDSQVKMVIFPRGIEREGNTKIHSLNWKSLYGSFVLQVFSKTEDGIPASTADGINEKGFTVELNAFRESDYRVRDKRKPAISMLMWAQFYLDQFATVEEAVRYTESNELQIEPFYYDRINRYLGTHMSIADASGDSAVIEYLNGTVHVYHDKNYKIMTNSPSYSLQIKNLTHFAGFGGNKPLPGSSFSPDRFVRAAFYEKFLPKANSLEEEINALLSIMEAVAQPEGIVSKERPELSRTIWRSIADLTHRTYYFQSRKQPQLIFASIYSFNLNPGSDILEYDPAQYPKNIGDISAYFYPKQAV